MLFIGLYAFEILSMPFVTDDSILVYFIVSWSNFGVSVVLLFWFEQQLSVTIAEHRDKMNIGREFQISYVCFQFSRFIDQLNNLSGHKPAKYRDLSIPEYTAGYLANGFNKENVFV